MLLQCDRLLPHSDKSSNYLMIDYKTYPGNAICGYASECCPNEVNTSDGGVFFSCIEIYSSFLCIKITNSLEKLRTYL